MCIWSTETHGQAKNMSAYVKYTWKYKQVGQACSKHWRWEIHTKVWSENL